MDRGAFRYLLKKIQKSHESFMTEQHLKGLRSVKRLLLLLLLLLLFRIMADF